MKSLLLPVLLAAAAALVFGCKTADPAAAGDTDPSGNAYGNPQGYSGRTGGYPSDSDYVKVAPVPPEEPRRGEDSYRGPVQPPESARQSSGGSYTVQKGDTLYGISRRHSTTLSALKSANNLTSDTIRPGQVLRIP